MNATAMDHQAGALEEYSKRKLELAGTVRSLLNFAEQRKDEMAVGDCRRLLARLAKDRFNLAFVGQFSRGKSSLMNAILGAEKLPTGVLPLTSVITTVAYGETECVLLQREGWTLPQETRLEQLPEYVTRNGNPGNEKKVTLAEIHLPHQLLSLGAHFIDTPGIDSAIRANTRTTRQFLPEIDAAILVTTFESPFAESELNFLREVRSHARTVFVVVNKQDLVSTDEKDAVVQAIRDELKAAFDDHFELFAVSARDALSAKQAGSHEELLNSGLPDLEAALVKFLRTRKARELLLRAGERAEAIAQRQKISIQISEQARSAELARVLNRKLHDFSETIRNDQSALIRRQRDRARQEIAKRLHNDIQSWTPDAEAYLLSESRKWFLQDDGLAAHEFAEFLRKLSQQLFAHMFSRNGEEIERAFTALWQQEAAAMERVAGQIFTLPWQVIGVRTRIDAAETRPIEIHSLHLRGLDMSLTAFELPWWYDLIPRGKLRELASRRWERRVPEFVERYLGSVQQVLDAAAEDWIANIDRQFQGRLHETGAHIRKLLQAKSDSAVWAEIGTILDRLRTFRDAVERMGGAVDASDALDSPHTTHNSRRSIVAPCRICSRLERVVWDFMAHAQYELSVRENCQHLHASRSGFCPLHTWQYEAVSSPQGVCAAYPEVLVRFAEQLRTLADHGKSLQAIAEGLRLILPRHSSCKVCGLISSEEQVAADQIAREISVNPAQCPPLCAYHLHAVLAANPKTEAATRLLRKEATALASLAEEMQSFVLKRAAARHHLTTKTENEAAMAGLARLAGGQRLAGPWRID